MQVEEIFIWEKKKNERKTGEFRYSMTITINFINFCRFRDQNSHRFRDQGSNFWVKIWDQLRKNIPRYDPVIHNRLI